MPFADGIDSIEALHLAHGHTTRVPGDDRPDGSTRLRGSPTDAVIREVVEETGLQVKVERLLGIYVDVLSIA